VNGSFLFLGVSLARIDLVDLQIQQETRLPTLKIAKIEFIVALCVATVNQYTAYGEEPFLNL
jgi:hypothetical protein